ncbi:MAG: PTS sugar transporter subunit IIA [Myxococcales bacterium]|nr:PTS sugar transporter subunit IIA [Myxococcales bacterium]
MRIVDFIREDMVLPELRATTKQGALEEFASHLAERAPLATREALARALAEREKLASTAIGEGVAIPHGKLDAVGNLIACVGRAPKGIEFDSMDGQPTHLFFVLVAPENSTGVHLKALARISRLFKDSDFRARLMAAPDAHGLYQMIIDEDAKY